MPQPTIFYAPVGLATSDRECGRSPHSYLPPSVSLKAAMAASGVTTANP